MMKQSVIVSGSLAYDRIFDYPGRFSDVILPAKVHILNVSFTVRDVRESYGGTAGNIAYTLGLLSVAPIIAATLGVDGGAYLRHLKRSGADVSLVRTHRGHRSASAHIITDRDDNQIAAFQMGALQKPLVGVNVELKKKIRRAAYAIVAPGNTRDMLGLVQRYHRSKLPFLFDPGQTIAVLKRNELRFLMQRSSGLISNDYELDLLLHRSGLMRSRLFRMTPMTITTLGPKGARCSIGAKTVHVRASKPKSEIDPTGAGDAFRAGLIAGMVYGKDILTSLKMGAVASVYTVEREGTQTHTFTKKQFSDRFRQNYGDRVSLNEEY